MRTHPIGTGPFKFVEFKANESIKLTRNPDYWKKGLPYLDGIEFTIIPNRSTAILAFVAGKFDMTFPTEVTIPLLKDVKSQDAQGGVRGRARQRRAPTSSSIRRRRRSTIPTSAAPWRWRSTARPSSTILFEGQADIGGTMLPAPDGLWGMPKEMLETIPGYGPDVEANRDGGAQADGEGGLRPEQAAAGQGFDPQHPGLSRPRRDPDRSAQEHLYRCRAGRRRNRQLVLEGCAQGLCARAQPHRQCGRRSRPVVLRELLLHSERNYTNYCNPALEKLFDQQSQETDFDKRKKLVWEIDKKLQDDVARPIIYHGRTGTCWQPYVKGVTVMVNSSYNGYRYEDVWLDK